ncbi:hypothetical protein MBLNU230_g5558t1 [Neophaeotheca triangularis]
MRLPYAPTTPSPSAPQSTHETYAAITARRSPRPLQPLDLALLHNPSIASGWNSLLGAIRTTTTLSQAYLELAVCRIAVVTGAVYEWRAHSKLAVQEGVSAGVLSKVLEAGREGVVELGEGGSRVQAAVVRFAEDSTREVQVGMEVWEAVREAFTQEVREGDGGGEGKSEEEVNEVVDRMMMELTVCVAGYNMVSRFLVGLDVAEANGTEMVLPEGAV